MYRWQPKKDNNFCKGTIKIRKYIKNLIHFVSGFFGNAILAMLLTYLGEKLNVDIYLAAIFVFVGRMFNNLGFIRRYYIEKWAKNKEIKKSK